MSSFYHTVLSERLEYWFKAILHKASHYTKFLTGFYKLTANIKIWFLPISCLQYNFVDSYHELNCIQASAGTCWLGCWEPHIMYEVRFCGVFHPTMYNIRQKHHFFLTQTAKKKRFCQTALWCLTSRPKSLQSCLPAFIGPEWSHGRDFQNITGYRSENVKDDRTCSCVGFHVTVGVR